MNDVVSNIVRETVEDLIDKVENRVLMRTRHILLLDGSSSDEEGGVSKCSCERCGYHQEEIQDRMRLGVGLCSKEEQRRLFPGDFLSVKDMGSPDGSELICQSCSVNESQHINDPTPARWCTSCQVSNKIKDSIGNDMSDTGILSGDDWQCYKCCVQEICEMSEHMLMEVEYVEYVEYDEDPYSIPRVVCPHCGASDDEGCVHHPLHEHPGRFGVPHEPRGTADEDQSLTCESCGREWDGNAQCPCGMGHIIDSSGEDEIATTWGQVSSWIEEYEGEYEVDDDPPENNSEVATEIKDSVKELGEQLFDIQEKLSEGEYLKMMDILQKITNKTNSL